HLKTVFVKGLNSHTDKVFTVTQVLDKHDPVLYKLQDFFQREMEGSFYERELVKVPPYMQNSFRVERILRQRVRNGRPEVLVKWMDHGDEFNTWEPADNIVVNLPLEV
ncbi:Y26D4A.11 protein, partial [Aphelenchoides avenae]